MGSAPESLRPLGRRTDFLTLPREVRDMIYELALVNPSPIVVYSANIFNNTPWENLATTFTLALVMITKPSLRASEI